MGKLSSKDLKKLLSCIKNDPSVVIPPLPGFDSGVHLIDDKYLVVSTDPCIGVPTKWFGWLLIHYAASDVALFGAKPQYGTIVLLSAPSTTTKTFLEVMNQASKAADQIGMTIITGHTGTYQGISTLAGVCTAYGIIEKEQLITPGGAQPGDCILCTKHVGLEIAVNLSLTNEAKAKTLFGAKTAKKLKELISTQSCVKDASLLSQISGVHAMHDATEGGLVAALNEIAEASKLGFNIEFERIPIAKESRIMKEHFRLSDTQLLSMSSTGTVLAAIRPESEDVVTKTLRLNSINASVLGAFTKDKKRILVKGGKKTLFPRIEHDPYARILSGWL
jgi:hydrogenase expression/formation protein HypE